MDIKLIMVVRFTKQGKIFTVRHTFHGALANLTPLNRPVIIRTHTEVNKQHNEHPTGDIRIRQNGIYLPGLHDLFCDVKVQSEWRELYVCRLGSGLNITEVLT